MDQPCQILEFIGLIFHIKAICENGGQYIGYIHCGNSACDASAEHFIDKQASLTIILVAGVLRTSLTQYPIVKDFRHHLYAAAYSLHRFFTFLT